MTRSKPIIAMKGAIGSKWNALETRSKLSAIIGLILGIWGIPLFALVLEQAESGIFGEGEYGVGLLFLALIPASAILIISGASVLILNTTRKRRTGIVLLVSFCSIVPVLMTVAYAIHLRYWCWPHHPISFCP